MAPRFAVDRLTVPERDFVISCLVNGLSDREIEGAFFKEFNGKKLAKSSIARWREAVGEQAKEKFSL
ncbi:MAG TPA: hypothetical protein VI756_04950, partial [Blastocatellia bacterium]